MKDIKVGDTVHVKADVSALGDKEFTEVRFASRFGGWLGWVKNADIVHVEPRPIKAGDKVRLCGENRIYEVMGVCGGYLWVTFESQAPFTVAANRVTGVILK